MVLLNKSDIIHSVNFDDEFLKIVLSDCSKEVYANIDEIVYTRLLESDSPDDYFKNNIQKFYSYSERITIADEIHPNCERFL